MVTERAGIEQEPDSAVKEAFQETEAAQAIESEAPSTAGESTGEAPPAEPDYKSLYESEQAQKSKLEHKLSSFEGTRRKEWERDELLHELAAGQKTLEKGFGILSNVVTEDDREEVPAQLQATLREGQNTQASSRFQRLHDRLLEDTVSDIAEVTDSEGKPLLDLHRSPEFEEIRAEWNDAAKAGDMVKLTALKSQATSMVFKVGRGYDRKQTAAAKEAAKTARKRALDETGALDLDTGPGSPGGSNMTLGEAAAAFNAGQIDAAQYKKYRGY